MNTVSTPEGIAYFRLASLKASLKMEKVGLQTRGGALRPRLAAEFGLKPRDSYELYIKTINDRMSAMIRGEETAH